MNKFLKVKLFDKSKTDEERKEVILNPLAISAILPNDEKDVIKMQNGDVYEVVHASYYPTENLLHALEIVVKKS